VSATLTAAELAQVSGGFHLPEAITRLANEGYAVAVKGVRDGYRGAVNWGVGAYAGTQAAMQLYENRPSAGAWFAQVKGIHDALDGTGRLPDAVPFSSSYK